jgi:hypothetical protein
LIAKAITRTGNAKKKLEDGIEKSMSKHRTPKTMLKKKREEELKGNEYFKKGDPDDPKLYSTRHAKVVSGRERHLLLTTSPKNTKISVVVIGARTAFSTVQKSWKHLQSPDINPIEILWDHAISPVYCQKLVDSMLNRLRCVLKQKGYATKY